ncbi:MAG: tetratricopeptide repeat protein [Burkholderiaceae bacterium]|nr:tetratricopeptide repeat protein [Burkholderiaceae bacterium]
MSEFQRPAARHRVPFKPVCGALGWVLAALIHGTVGATPTAPPVKATTDAVAATEAPTPRSSALTAELIYLVLVGEMQLQSKEAGAAYSLILDAARKSGEDDLYRRAIQIALQSRSGDAAITAARYWANNNTINTEPLRLMLQIMLSQDQIERSQSTLENLLEATDDATRNEVIDLVGNAYSRVGDKAAAVRVLSRALRLWQRNSANASSAWAALARTQQAAGLTDEANQSMARALDASPVSGSVGVLAVEWLQGKTWDGEPAFIQHLGQQADPLLVRMAYARYLLGASRWADARRELQWLTHHRPDAAEPWLLQGALQLQDQRLADAEASFQRFLTLADTLDSDRRSRATAQAYVSLSQIAESQSKLDEAQAWLDKIDNTDNPLSVQLRQASLLAKQGKHAEAVALLESLPTEDAGDRKTKWLAQAQLLRNGGKADEALAITHTALLALPNDIDLLLEQSLLYEKLALYDEMERVLRLVIGISPDNAHAYNALGYSLADRNLRLDEAAALIQTAIALAPEDAFIIDSLGWVEFRQGKVEQAAATLRRAWNLRPDAEIAAHLAEVLWTLRNIDEARHMLNEAKRLQPDNETLQRTMERIGLP